MRAARGTPQTRRQRPRPRVVTLDPRNEPRHSPKVSGYGLFAQLFIGELHETMVLLNDLLRQLDNIV
jgi:hypothetical protein